MLERGVLKEKTKERTDCITWSDHFHDDTDRIGCSPR